MFRARRRKNTILENRGGKISRSTLLLFFFFCLQARRFTKTFPPAMHFILAPQYFWLFCAVSWLCQSKRQSICQSASQLAIMKEARGITTMMLLSPVPPSLHTPTKYPACCAVSRMIAFHDKFIEFSLVCVGSAKIPIKDRDAHVSFTSLTSASI